MIRIFVVHNNEGDRLSYLGPRLSQLIDALQAAGHEASLEMIGPNVDLIRENPIADTFLNRLRRAKDASDMFDLAAAAAPERAAPSARIKAYLRCFAQHVLSYRRSIRIEQEVLFAHAFCWRACAGGDDLALVLESDALFREETLGGVIALLDFLHDALQAKQKIYVDLAGGCDRDAILYSWAFKPEHGCEVRPLPGAPATTLLIPGRLVGNTVGGYFMSPALAAEIYAYVMKARPMLPPDWAFNLYAARARGVLCVHTSPTLFAQGSSAGAYQSSIDPAAGRA
jgi:hypothetical protein